MAKRSLADGSGYLQIDHRDSPGLSPADVAHIPGAQAVAGGVNFETDIQQCTHCQRGVLLNRQRVRPRGYCAKCDHYICDDCANLYEKVGLCVPMVKVIDVVQNQVERFGSIVQPIPDPGPVVGPIIVTDADDPIQDL